MKKENKTDDAKEVKKNKEELNRKSINRKSINRNVGVIPVIVLTISILLIYVALNIGLSESALVNFDWTGNSLYTLTDESKNKMKEIDGSVSISIVGFSDTTYPTIQELEQYAKQYRDVNSNINYEVVYNINTRTDLKDTYAIVEGVPVIIIKSALNSSKSSEQQSDEEIDEDEISDKDGSYKVLQSTDLYTYNAATGRQIDVVEEALTNAITDVTLKDRPNVYFVSTGLLYSDNETELATNTFSSGTIFLQAFIKNNGNNVYDLDIATENIPSDCDVLVLQTIFVDYTDEEQKKIMDYIQNGGNVLFMIDPNVYRIEQPGFAKLFEFYGFSFDVGAVAESNLAPTNAYLNNPLYIIPNLNVTHEISKDIAYSGNSVILIQANKIDFMSDEELSKRNISVSPFLTATASTFYRTDFESKSEEMIDSDVFVENAVLGATVEKKIDENKTSKAVVYGNSLFVNDNYTYQIPGGNDSSNAQYTTPLKNTGNKRVILNSIKYLTGRDDLIQLKKDTGILYFKDKANIKQTRTITIIIIAIPIIVAIVGVVILVKRRIRS
jgi:ABC-2 type transport system permease protein